MEDRQLNAFAIADIERSDLSKVTELLRLTLCKLSCMRPRCSPALNRPEPAKGYSLPACS